METKIKGSRVGEMGSRGKCRRRNFGWGLRKKLMKGYFAF